MTKTHYSDNIRNFTMGAVVRNNASWRNHYGNVPGHVIGFSLNSSDEVTIEVKWADGTIRSSHPANLELV